RDVQQTAAAVWDEQRQKEREKYGEDAEDEFQPNPIREQKVAHVILPRVNDDVVLTFRHWEDDHPGMVEVQTSRKRAYPWSERNVVLDRSSLPAPLRQQGGPTLEVHVQGVADHILGAMRDEVWNSDVARRPFQNPATGKIDLGWYAPGDSVGARGLEMVFEDTLRGLRGVKDMRKDRDDERRVEPVSGHDLKLTLDISLQARVQAIMSPEFGLTRVQDWHLSKAQMDGVEPHLPLGTKLDAAAVVIEVETGEVLAMVTMPTLAMGSEMSDDEQASRAVWANRPVEAVYPPGSILKPLVLSAAMTEGELKPGESIECKGHYFPDQPGKLRCWIDRPIYSVRQHGPLQASEALARSCNIFFYTLGDRLGIDRLSHWLGRFGLGSPLNVGLMCRTTNDNGDMVTRGEVGGHVPGSDEIAAWKHDGSARFRQILMGIGQGDVTWTPVQAANAYATIARGGVIRDASLLMDDPRGTRPGREDMHLSTVVQQTVLEGLWQGVHQHYGSSNHLRFSTGVEEKLINARGVKVWAKTGTAQAPLRKFHWQDTNHDGKIDENDEASFLKDSSGQLFRLDHAWFVGLVGPASAAKPTHAIAVVVEYGGSGGRAAGPIGNQIIHALQAEGYLPDEGEDVGEILRNADGVEEPMPEDEHD
ncbi:MAG TPA: penicillin-binding transpeptidase domain-containing protein, partial [Phycisphaerales bacterium]|nr:penicillin-binding transpeptidase domain-containing protein [Phycisphaerales bacterium]